MKDLPILLLEGVHPCVEEAFRAKGFTNVEYHKKALPKEELAAKLEKAAVVGIRSKTELTSDLISQAPHLMAIGCFCIGTNQVALETATNAGIPVFNSPYSNTRSVAELVVAEAVMLLRGVPARSRAAHDGIWLKDANKSYEVRNKTIGIVGYGHIGSQVSVMAESLGMRVIYYDIEPKLPLGNAHAVASLNELLSKADILTLHVPGGTETNNLIDAAAISKMKKGAILLNLSRGSVVDLEALKQALENGDIIGAGLDVYPSEPKAKGDAFKLDLQGCENVILTPHIGGSTQEAQENIGQDVATKLLHFIENGTSTGSNSIPALNLPIQQNTHRILHIHENAPGVLGAINVVLSELDINIAGQYLKTNEKVGYVVLDIEGESGAVIEEKLSAVPHTIRTRLLF